MNALTHCKYGLAILPAILCACGHQPALGPPSPAIAAHSAQAHTETPAARFASIDAYKNNVARHIMRCNEAHAFSGQLPPMLPAIVVVNISVDRNGNLMRVRVQRSRDDGASVVALESLARSKPLPKPLNLLAASQPLLTFSETFLFTDGFHFQLRSLAQPQMSEAN